MQPFNKLQLVQICADRLIVGDYKYDHITPLLGELYWLPVEHSITFELLLITLKGVNNLALCYIGDLLHLCNPNRLLGFHLNFSCKFLHRILKLMETKHFLYVTLNIMELPSELYQV